MSRHRNNHRAIGPGPRPTLSHGAGGTTLGGRVQQTRIRDREPSHPGRLPGTAVSWTAYPTRRRRSRERSNSASSSASTTTTASPSTRAVDAWFTEDVPGRSEAMAGGLSTVSTATIPRASSGRSPRPSTAMAAYAGVRQGRIIGYGAPEQAGHGGGAWRGAWRGRT